MPLYTLLQAVQADLDGLACPGRGNAVAYLNPPASGSADVGQATLFVWSSGLKERRRSAPRMTGGNPSSAGFKDMDHSVAVYVLMVDDPTDAKAGRAFFQAVDAIQAKLRSLSLPITLTDPDTGVVTFVTMIGEEFSVEFDVVRATSAQRYVRYLARVTTTAHEQLQS